MLDSDTKRRIDTARDILVGKVPDPKSQVEQITIALIYKFMDDMDAESEELGGNRKFFTKEFARYGWAKLMSPGLGGHEMLGLYAEGITKMPENPGIPPLFREIFKNAYLPYRDPETLKAFLKIVDEFSYDHSERLGDAFEYLLSVLGSQGDAGQFRTPRHIIDLMVSIIDPKKTETVLDPACGTAGFLISSYKHIVKANVDAEGRSTLTPDEKGRLATNFKGYDISPDMVRLSLVNLYLHGFTDPHIYEYDTLTSEERWNEFADVMLANPPFMSPKGGIKPHKRFSIQAKRSEVLFVDYIAEHLTPNGRAGIIVPEGIIFQSQSAYKELRKILVENSLVAVVSLPAGCFNPYSGVKTSILILDKSIARHSHTIAFFKVESDGFGLGAQRRAIEKNDLPQVQVELAAYLQAVRSHQATADLRPTFGLIVSKEDIAANRDYSLSGDRYREGAAQTARFPHVRLDEIARITAGNSAPQGAEYFVGGAAPFIRTSDVGAVHLSDNLVGAADKVNAKAIEELRLELFPTGTILFPKSGASTFLNHRAVLGAPGYVSSHLACIICDETKALPKYVYSWLCRVDARSITPDQAYPSLRLTEIGAIELPLPPLAAQKEIVEEIEGYQKVINGARVVLEHYRPRIHIQPDWPVVQIDEVCELGRGRVISKPDINANPGPYPVYSSQTSEDGVFGYLATYDFDGEYVTWTTDGANAGTVFYRTGRFNCTNVCGTLKCRAEASGMVDMKFLSQVLGQVSKPYVVQVGNPKLMNKEVARIPIPLPPLTVQRAAVAEVEAEAALVAGNRDLVVRFEQKIQATLNRIWGEEPLAAPEP